MATVRREIYLNPLEPSPFSFRAPADVSITLETTIMKQNETPYTADLELAIQLSPRSGGVTQVYAMPSTDLANGKARAMIPALNDINGYNIEVVGTVDGTLEMIAAGVIQLAGRGIPVSEAIDAIDNIPLTITRNLPLTLDLKLWQDAGKNHMYTGAVVVANLRDQVDGTVIANLNVIQMAQPNEVRLTLSAAQTASLPGTISIWDVVVIAGGQSQTVIRGEVRFKT